MRYHLAIDIGASSGRLILGWYTCGAMQTEEIHRFENGMTEKDGQLCWDLESIFNEIKIGIKKAETIGKPPCSIGIDTWGVDFVLLDEYGNILGNPVAYRDSRTTGVDDIVHAIVPEEELYARTGIQSQIFNTVYQLMALKHTQPGLLEAAAHMLLVPDYLHYRLCGAITNEYTNATTTGLVNAHTRKWDMEIIGRLGFPEGLFRELTPPGSVIGSYTPGCDVIATATHDTASAVMMAMDDAIYISSGTWSLMGLTLDVPVLSPESRLAGFTNEGGYDNSIVYCKNIMGLWMIQCVRKELEDKYSYAQLCEMAEAANIASIVDCGSGRFFAPASMTLEIKNACADSNQQVPKTPGELAKVVYQSLAASYAHTVTELENLTGKTYSTINIIGGGAKAEYLNQLTAQRTGKKIIAGPAEATAIGNLTAQALALKEAR